jgi:hypothetical protein
LGAREEVKKNPKKNDTENEFFKRFFGGRGKNTFSRQESPGN